MYKRFVAGFLGAILAISPLTVFAEENLAELKLEEDLPASVAVISIAQSLPAKSAILIDQASGQVLYEQNPDEPLPPASITKVMTLLLVMEALEGGKIHLDDKVVATEHAASMGGSQIWLKVGEEMSVDDLLKAVAISSANDAAVALAEHVGGSEDAFIDMMNRRAGDLGMENTHFLNASGLDETGHISTARDIALMSRELIKHPRISQYSTIWMDSLRNGETELVNTNRMIRFYKGATGLKTGTTSGAGSCLSATATRDGLSLVAVVMGSPTSDERFASARGLLDYGFANYMAYSPPELSEKLIPIKVMRGTSETVMPVADSPPKFVIDKLNQDSIVQEITLAQDLQAPVEAGQIIGKIQVMVDGAMIGEYPLRAAEKIDRMTFDKAFGMLIKKMLTMGPQGKEPILPFDTPGILPNLETSQTPQAA